jgi:hypothetical protein
VFILTIHTRVMLPRSMLCVVTSTVLPMHSLNSLGSLPAGDHSSIPQQSDHRSISKRRRSTLPAASEQDEPGPSRFAESSVPSLRIRRCRNPPPSAFDLKQGGFFGFLESSIPSLRTRRPHNYGRQLRKFQEPCYCVHLPITTHYLCYRTFLKL